MGTVDWGGGTGLQCRQGWAHRIGNCRWGQGYSVDRGGPTGLGTADRGGGQDHSVDRGVPTGLGTMGGGWAGLHCRWGGPIGNGSQGQGLQF